MEKLWNFGFKFMLGPTGISVGLQVHHVHVKTVFLMIGLPVDQ